MQEALSFAKLLSKNALVVATIHSHECDDQQSNMFL